ncbi:hypothetical protein [Marinimicrobium koreense]|uniref:hypothetical protein n=1 Tax=Marinimicrobium koreense TaxID=306545 RepID=UPI000F4B038E|nr:hypothetical protein [Marinimicrobium koreense]
MTKDLEILQSMFEDYFSSDSNSPIYDIRIVSLDSGKKRISAELTFKEKEAYCCSEATCHFKPDWSRIRKIAVDKGVALSTPLSIDFSVTVEEGAKIGTNKSIGLPPESALHKYRETFSEKT